MTCAGPHLAIGARVTLRVAGRVTPASASVWEWRGGPGGCEIVLRFDEPGFGDAESSRLRTLYHSAFEEARIDLGDA